MSPTLSDRLRQTRHLLQKRRWLALVLHGALAATVLLLVLAGLNRLRPVQEQGAFLLLVAAIVGFAGYLAWVSIRIWRRPPPLPELAARVEEKHPEWMDSLICVTEQEQKEAEKRRPLEKMLVARVQRKIADIDFREVLLPARWRNKPLLASFIALLVLGGLIGTSSFLQKGGFFFSDLVAGAASGIHVRPGNDEAPVRTDVRVAATVLRWEDEPEIEYIDETGRHTFPMHKEDENHSFTFYDIDEDVVYRILTPSLTSPWYQITSYVPPSIDSTRVRVTPPAYTGLPDEEFDELGDLSAVEGSRIEWQLVSPTAENASLRIDGNENPLTPGNEGEHSLELPLRESFIGRFNVKDEDGRSARTREFQVKAQPDEFPTIEVTRPGRDTDAEPLAEVALTALAADDFGLTGVELHVSVSGRRQPPVSLFSNDAADHTDAPRITERTVRSALKLAELEAEEGDVVTYFFTATDNREPEAQQTRSEVFFIEVREETEPEEMEGEPMELEQIDLQALILELKRLIRLSWESTAKGKEQLEREIAAGLEEVRMETASIQQEVVDQLGEEAAAPMVALLNQSMQRMETASQLVDQKLVDDSIPYQEMALADIVAIQNELMKNQTSSEEPSEGSSGGESQPQPESGEEDDTLEEIQRLMSEVQKLSDDQAAQNSAMRRAGSSGLSAEQQEEFQRRQDALHERTKTASDDLMNLPGGDRARSELSAASTSMETASARIEENRADAAARDGDRARSSLLSALESLEDAMGQATGNQISQLAQQAQELARQQGDAAGGSRSLAESETPSAEEAAALREQQEAMQQRLENLLASLDDTANQLRDEHPEASRAIADAGQELRERNVPGEMGRAGNALLYRRYERAADIQESASENLGEFAQSLDESAGLLPAMSREQLQQLLNELQRAQQEVMDMTGRSADEIGERLEQITSRLGESLGRAGQALNDSDLQELSGQLAAASSNDRAPDIFRTDSMLRAASRALEQRIFALEVERRARLQRQTSEPPERYRGLVEEYFKDLSETP